MNVQNTGNETNDTQYLEQFIGDIRNRAAHINNATPALPHHPRHQELRDAQRVTALKRPQMDRILRLLEKAS